MEGTEDFEVRFAADERRPWDYGPFPYPGPLAVSHEARQDCLKHYQKVADFSYTIYTPRYFDFERDMLLFQRCNFTTDFKLVQNLFINNATDANIEDTCTTEILQQSRTSSATNSLSIESHQTARTFTIVAALHHRNEYRAVLTKQWCYRLTSRTTLAHH